MESNSNLLFKYAAFASQLLVLLIVFVYIGYLVDKYFIKSFPLFVWFFPLLIIIAVIFRTIRDTSKKK